MKTIFSFILTCLFATGMQAQIDRSVQPEPGPAPKINLEDPETFDLDNGLEVLVVEDHKLPTVTARIVIDNMPHSEAKPGTAALVSALLGTGTEKISKDAYNEEIDFMGASVSFGSESAYASSLSKFFPRVFELMAVGALKPKFTQQEFDDQKNQLLESLKFSDKDVASIASRMSNVLAYGIDHPYGEFATPESVESITLADVQAYYDTYFVPENAYLVVVGDIDDDKVKDLSKKYLANWKAKAPPAVKLPAVTPVASTQIDFVDMPNAVQSELRVQNLVDLKMSDDDYFPLLVANQILGGSFGSYLNMNLREEHGFTYGARSGFGTDEYGAAKFVASASVRNAVTDSAVVETIKEINRIKTEPVTQEDLELAKSKFAGNFVMALERPSTIANYALNIETENLDDDFYENYLKKIDAVTPEDVQRVANKYFNMDHMRLIVVGKGSDVAESLEQMKFLGKDIPVVYYDKFGNKVEKPEFNKEVDPSVTADAVFDKYIEAIGGKEAVEGVKSIFIVAQADLQGQKLDLEMKKTNNGKMAVTVSMAGNVLSKQVFNGEKGSIVARGQTIPYTDEQIIAAKAEANPFPELIASDDAKVLGIEPVDGKDAYVVSMSEDTKNYYSVESGLKLKTVKTVSQGAQTMSLPTTFSDYQEVQGIKFPFKITQSMGPQTFEFNVSAIKVNEGISDADFE